MYEVIYIALKKEATVKSNKINIFGICDIYSSDYMKSELNNMIFPVDEDVCVVSAIDVIKKISDVFPNVLIQNMSSTTDCVIKKQKKKNNFFVAVKVFLLSIIMLFGAAIGIISFNEDVNMKDTHNKIYTFFTGEETKDTMLLSIPYAIGIAGGFLAILKITKSKKGKYPGLLELNNIQMKDEIDKYNIDKKE